MDGEWQEWHVLGWRISVSYYARQRDTEDAEHKALQ